MRVIIAKRATQTMDAMLLDPAESSGEAGSPLSVLITGSYRTMLLNRGNRKVTECLDPLVSILGYMSELGISVQFPSLVICNYEY